MLNVLRQSSVVGVLAIGMTFVIATAGIDLSVGSMVAAAGVAGGLLVDSGSARVHARRARHGDPARRHQRARAIAYGKVVPFIATLAMFAMARGLALWMSDKTPISLFEAEAVRWFGNGEVVGIPSARDRLRRRHRRSAGCCSTAPATAATWSRSAATARRRGSPA